MEAIILIVQIDFILKEEIVDVTSLIVGEFLELEELHLVAALVFAFKGLEFLIDINREALTAEHLLHPAVDIYHVSLFDVVLVAKGFIKHGTNALDEVQVVVRQHMSKSQNKFTTITNDTSEVLLIFICHHLNKWGEHKAKKNINHWDRGKSST